MPTCALYWDGTDSDVTAVPGGTSFVLNETDPWISFNILDDNTQRIKLAVTETAGKPTQSQWGMINYGTSTFQDWTDLEIADGSNPATTTSQVQWCGLWNRPYWFHIRITVSTEDLNYKHAHFILGNADGTTWSKDPCLTLSPCP